MNHKIEFKREDMTYEEFVILCAKLPLNDKKYIVNPINSLDAKYELSKKIEKRPDFFEFCINNFLEMHHPISRSKLLDTIDEKLLYFNDISFDLYDILIQKFFIECQPKLGDITIQTIFRIQVKIFHMLYEHEFWKQLFFCDDCDTYIFKYPKHQIIGFLNSLINYIHYGRNMNKFVQQMLNDGVIEVIIKYLFSKFSDGESDLFDTLNNFIELLDFSVTSKIEITDIFLNHLKENSIYSIKFLSSIFPKPNPIQSLSDAEKAEIINFIQQKKFINYFIGYLDAQMSKEKSNIDTNSISQFSILLYNMFISLLPSDLESGNQNENELLFNLFNSFNRIFIQTLICLDSIPNEYSKFLFKLSLILPNETNNLLHILIDKINFQITNYQNNYNSNSNISNYIELYIKIIDYQTKNINAEDKNKIYFQLFQSLGASAENLNRTELILDILSNINDINQDYELDVIDTYYYNEEEEEENYDIYEYNNKTTTRSHDYNPSTVNLLQAVVAYFMFLLDINCPPNNEDKEHYIKLILLYSQFVFECAKTFDENQCDIFVIRIFILAINDAIHFKAIISRFINEFSELIQKVDNMNSIVFNMLLSLDPSLILSGLKILDYLYKTASVLNAQQRNEIIFSAIQRIMGNFDPAKPNLSIMNTIPLFNSTSIRSINSQNANGSQLQPEIVSTLCNFMMTLRTQITDQIAANYWLSSFLHFFEFNFFGNISDMFVQKQEDASNFDFERVTILAKEMKRSVKSFDSSLAISDQMKAQIDFILKIVGQAAIECTKLINEFILDENERIFNMEYIYEATIPTNVREAMDFANEATDFLIPLFEKFPLVEMYKILLPFFKLCCTTPIIKKEKTLSSIFIFIANHDQGSINDFLQCSLKLLQLIINNRNYLNVLISVAKFHRFMAQNNQEKFLEAAKKNQLPEKYLNILFDFSCETDSKLFNKNISNVFYKKNSQHYIKNSQFTFNDV